MGSPDNFLPQTNGNNRERYEFELYALKVHFSTGAHEYQVKYYLHVLFGNYLFGVYTLVKKIINCIILSSNILMTKAFLGQLV